MTETPKYYTPELSEFYIGFEYEIATNTEFGQSVEQATWRKQTFSFESVVMSNFDRDVLSKGVLFPMTRVKFTDKEDIESLGWKFKDKCQWEIPFTYSFNEMGIGEVNNVKGGWKLMFTKDGWCSIVKDCYGETSHFRGTIKNKSELKKLMNQLGINVN